MECAEGEYCKRISHAAFPEKGKCTQMIQQTSMLIYSKT